MTNEILRISRLKKSYGVKVVLDDLALSLNRTDRAALIGENGAGKSTLARLIMGEEQPDGGEVRLLAGAEIGYLPQEVLSEQAVSVRVYVENAIGGIAKLREEMASLEGRMSEGGELASLLERYGELQERFESGGGYDLEHRMEQVFAGLEIGYLDQERLLNSLSGGEKTRVALAALLLREPALLILDEPTNHLDFAGLAWLENYLESYPHALLLISHDRHFINKIVNQIIELSPQTHRLSVYHGGYDDYLAQREQQYQNELAAFQAQREEAKRLQMLAKEQAHARRKGKPPADGDKMLASKMKATVQQTTSRVIRDTKQRLADIEENKLENPTRHWRIKFEFQPAPLGSAQAVRLANLSKRYGEKVLLDGVNAVIGQGDRIVIVAPNGAGKTTLLRLILGEILPDSGEISLSPPARLAYLAQEEDLFDPAQSVLEAYREDLVGTDKEFQAQLHRSGLFSGDGLLEKRAGDLSVGQRRKLTLAKLAASHANVLLLDEPTNHLDLASLEALEAGLRDFEGVILAISHDRWFIEHVANKVWHLEDGKIRAGQY